MIQDIAKQILEPGTADSYRVFLGELYGRMHALKKSYSYARFAEDLGISSGMFANQIVHGHRNLSARMARSVADRLRLAGSLRDFFLALVAAEDAGPRDDLAALFDDLAAIKARLNPDAISLKLYRYAKAWYQPVVRELALDPELRGDPALIAAACRPKISPTEARDSLALLVECGFLATSPDHPHYLPGDSSTRSPDEIHWLIGERYHQTVIDLAKEAVIHTNEDERSITSTTLRLRRADFERVRDLALGLHEAAAAAEPEVGRDQTVYQLNVQLFPVSGGRK